MRNEEQRTCQSPRATDYLNWDLNPDNLAPEDLTTWYYFSGNNWQRYSK